MEMVQVTLLRRTLASVFSLIQMR